VVVARVAASLLIVVVLLLVQGVDLIRLNSHYAAKSTSCAAGAVQGPKHITMLKSDHEQCLL
jgi:hypothetical protein